jgi:hypothetical protein
MAKKDPSAPCRQRRLFLEFLRLQLDRAAGTRGVQIGDRPLQKSRRRRDSASRQQSELWRLRRLAVKRGGLPSAQALMSAAQEVIGEVGRAVPIVLQGENAKIGRFDLELAAGQ